MPLGAALLPSGLASLLNGLILILWIAILVRVLMSWVPGMSYSTLGRVAFVLTDWLIAPIQRVVPPLGGIDFSPAIAIILLYAVQQLIFSGDLVQAVLFTIRQILILLILLMFVRVAIGFFRFDPWHPLVRVVVQSSEPLARPFRTWLPKRTGQFDWAPVAALATLVIVFYVVGLLPRTF